MTVQAVFHRVRGHTLIFGMLILLAGTGLVVAPGNGLAQSVPAIVTTNLKMRAGPSVEFPVIVVVPADSSVNLLGCMRDYSWCEVRAVGDRGWMSAQYIRIYDRGYHVTVSEYARVARVPTLGFDQDAYWSAHYRHLPFYQDRTDRPPERRSAGIQVGVFYDQLSPYGSWVYLRGQYVWSPRVDERWRPYSEGHWVHTRTYGWMWASDEPFGWATFHYGRWGYSHRIGWFWIPGTRWAPAWVAWRESGDHLAWAPLPPDTRGSVSISVTIGDIPNYYWQAVPTRSFLSVNLSKQIVRDPGRRDKVLRRTQPAGSVNIVNNVVVNNVINVTSVEDKTRKSVVTYDVSLTSDAEQSGKTEGKKLEIYHPPATENVTARKPAEVKSLEVVEKRSRTKNQAVDEPATEELMKPLPPQQEVAPPTQTPPTEEPSSPPASVRTEPSTQERQAPASCPKGTDRQDDGTCVRRSKSNSQKRQQTDETAPAASEQVIVPKPEPQQPARKKQEGPAKQPEPQQPARKKQEAPAKQPEPQQPARKKQEAPAKQSEPQQPARKRQETPAKQSEPQQPARKRQEAPAKQPEPQQPARKRQEAPAATAPEPAAPAPTASE